MGSRDDQTKPRQKLLSSVVVRPEDSGGGAGAADYESGEVRPDAPPASRSRRHPSDLHGHRERGLSGSPTHHHADRRFRHDFDRPGQLHHGRGFGGRGPAVRSPGRYRDFSPPFARENSRGRPFGKLLDGPGVSSSRFRGEGFDRNNTNNSSIRPREGDWYCSDPGCRNLNFARRDYCNNCNLRRDTPLRSPRRGYGGPPPPVVPPRRDAPIRSPRRGYGGPPLPDLPPRRRPVSPIDHLPVRFYSPPRGFVPRDLRPGGPPPSPRYEPLPRGRPDHHPADYTQRARFGRPLLDDWAPRRGDHGRDILYGDRKGYDRRSLSPPFGAHHRRWADHHVRRRSRSPLGGAAAPASPPMEFRRDMDRSRNKRHSPGAGRGRMSSVY